MIVVVLPEGGCWWTLSYLRKYGGDKLQTKQGGGETGEETVEDRKTTDQPAVIERERPKDPASLREMPMIRNALVSTV